MVSTHLDRVDCRCARHEMNTIVNISKNVFSAIVPAVRNNLI